MHRGFKKTKDLKWFFPSFSIAIGFGLFLLGTNKTMTWAVIIAQVHVHSVVLQYYPCDLSFLSGWTAARQMA